MGKPSHYRLYKLLWYYQVVYVPPMFLSFLANADPPIGSQKDNQQYPFGLPVCREGIPGL